MTNRRDFIKQMSAMGIAATMPEYLFPQEAKNTDNSFIWANLLHLSYNMWLDNVPEIFHKNKYNLNDCRDTYAWAGCYRPELTCEMPVWDRILEEMVNAGMNMVIIDLGDGVKYNSHPEISVKGAWTVSQLKKELEKIRKMGLEPIPKLNFSTGHKAWLGPYQRMISSKKYYTVCKNLIDEVCKIFGNPRFFHLGMDEETSADQLYHDYIVVRQNDLWWHDFYYLVDLVEKHNVRSWIWSDYAWEYPDLFFSKMPKSVLQSNWYYRNQFEKFDNPTYEKSLRLYDQLESHGFDQVPTGSNHYNDVNFGMTVEYCSKKIDPSRLKGFMQTVWRPTLAPCLERHIQAVNQVAESKVKLIKL